VVGQYVDSRYDENLIEHAFLSELLQYCRFVVDKRVEVLRPDVDAGGYDLVLEARGRLRHVQLKSRWYPGRKRNRTLDVNSRLHDHPDPCVVWTFWEVDPATCRVNLRYKYSEASDWPPQVVGASTFQLAWKDFSPGYLGVAGLMAKLF